MTSIPQIHPRVRASLARPVVVRALRTAIRELERAGSPELALMVRTCYLDPIRHDAIPLMAPGSDFMTLADIERNAILASWLRHGGRTKAVAAELGISQRKIQYSISRYRREGWIT